MEKLDNQGEPVARLRCYQSAIGPKVEVIKFTEQAFKPGRELDVYTHADPGEVVMSKEKADLIDVAFADLQQTLYRERDERDQRIAALHSDIGVMRELVEKKNRMLATAKEDAIALRAQLAERDELLQQALQVGGLTQEWHDKVAYLSPRKESGAPKCKYCEGRGSVCIDWEAGAWEDCSHCAPVNQSLVECDACPRSGGCVNTCMNDAHAKVVEVNAALRAQLAEAHGLLHDLAQANREYFPEEECPPQHPKLMARYAALSASAEPELNP